MLRARSQVIPKPCPCASRFLCERCRAAAQFIILYAPQSRPFNPTRLAHRAKKTQLTRETLYFNHEQHSNSQAARNAVPYFGLDFSPEIGNINREPGAGEGNPT